MLGEIGQAHRIVPAHLYGQAVMAGNYTITAANNTWVDTGFAIALPAAGTYLIAGSVRAEIQVNTTDGAYITVKLYQTDIGADVPNSLRFCTYVNANGSSGVVNVNFQNTMGFSVIVTVTAACSVRLYARRITSGVVGNITLSVIDSESTGGYTNLCYVRIA